MPDDTWSIHRHRVILADLPLHTMYHHSTYSQHTTIRRYYQFRERASIVVDADAVEASLVASIKPPPAAIIDSTILSWEQIRVAVERAEAHPVLVLCIGLFGSILQRVPSVPWVADDVVGVQLGLVVDEELVVLSTTGALRSLLSRRAVDSCRSSSSGRSLRCRDRSCRWRCRRSRPGTRSSCGWSSPIRWLSDG